ncbi:DUF805 domain-containing protein [Brevundimonas variabilis]|uniref:Uncharacterized membrane protein YhaH (DUF805 family) n=1 Tax=Brevundimonas variabilis TaxID=74312 RepID=A0A7W9CJ77_9CAUL|nr:DUF805 domain-containing protein [Brevundimonas variabilis]MBB5746678.1 uncharacterized membrane protein YhaH (DUF805 family) [Brevundimonas variabilis]
MLLLRPLIHYADFESRSRRAEYLQFMAAQSLVAGMLGVLGVRLIASAGASIGVALPILLGFVLLAAAALLIPNLAIQVRRLHDVNRSARWMGLMLPGILAPIVLLGSAIRLVEQVTSSMPADAVIAAQMGSLGTFGVIWGLGITCNVILFVMLLMPGTKGSNRFGPDPLDEAVQGSEASSVFDDARLEALFAEALRNGPSPEPAARPASPFLPVASQKTRAPTPREWPVTATPQNILPARAFGRRGG